MQMAAEGAGEEKKSRNRPKLSRRLPRALDIYVWLRRLPLKATGFLLESSKMPWRQWIIFSCT